jgi:hypothetical protein
MLIIDPADQPQPRMPDSLPHGLIAPPPAVRDAIEKERPKHPAEAFAKAEERLLSQWTLDHYFDGLGHEVAYRPTPQGPEVLAVGDQERLALRRRIGEEEYAKLQSYLPY